jgi:hypothetical protein
MYPDRLILAATLLLLASSSAPAQEAESLRKADTQTRATVENAIQSAARLLVHNQEKYEPDPPVGVLPDEELAPWQAKELERLEALRGSEEGCEWPYEGVYRVGPDNRIPAGYRLGGTAICCQALIEAPGYDENAARRAAVERATDHMISLIENDPALKSGPKLGYDVRGWGHVYALQFFLRALDRDILDDERRAIIEDLIPHLVFCIEENAVPRGGWSYSGNSTCSFMTSSTLLVLFHAKARGHFVPEEMVEKALDALQRARAEETGAFAYGARGTEPMGASAARAAIAELVLLQAGRSDGGRLRVAVDGFFDNWEHLLARKSKQGTHEPPYQIAPYYFYYGHTYAALAIEHLPTEDRQPLRGRLLELIWATREQKGGWNDRVFPRTESYSTAMVILALVAPRLPAVERWK